MKPKLIPNWRRAWRMFSVQAQAAAIAILGGWQALGPDLQAKVPSQIVYGLVVTLLVLGIVGRLVVQPKTKGPQATERSP